MRADRKGAENEQNDAQNQQFRPKVGREKADFYSTGNAQKTRSQRMERGHMGIKRGECE
jgi:hypothetical protein